MKTTIAALLHDIGKFYQRAEHTNAIIGKPLYEQYIKNNGYIHGAFTAKFIDENIQSHLIDYAEMLSMSAGHHKENFSVIKTADCIASGHDRRDADSEILKDLDYLDSNDENYINKRMNIIFNEIFIEGPNEPYKLLLTPFSQLQNTKISKVASKEEAKREYRNLYNLMVEELHKMNSKGYKDYKELHHYLYPIIKEYTIAIPSSTYNQNYPTVSLFDHLKLTTAIANCLKKNDANEYVLVDYDISGIQKFLYKVAEGRESKPNVAKYLRARSFYLSVLTDFIAYYIVNEFDMTYENVLYSSGGRGRILVPNSDDFDLKINKVSNMIEKSMFELHHGEISFAISYSQTTGEELSKMKIDDIIFEGKQIISDKKRKFKSVFIDSNFDPINNYERICPVCLSNEVSSDEECDFCKMLISLNNEFLVKENEFIVEYDFLLNEKSDKNCIKVPYLGTVKFHKLNNFSLNNMDSYYVSFNGHTIGETKKYPRSNAGNMSFEEISNNSKGDNKLAVIKMDVDNLGYIFQNGISDDKETISKNLTLSRMVDYFFTNELVSICDREKYKNSIYINYAGGDDLVIVLPASMCLELVKDINDEFQKFTGFNKSFHISSGVEIFSSSSPVRYAINRAEEFLNKSKNCDKKSSFTVLGSSLKNVKLEEIISEINIYAEALENDNLSRSGLYEIYNYIIRSLESKNKEIAFMKFIPLIAYSIKRNMNPYWFEKLKNIFVTQNININILEYYKIVFAMALMITRKRG